MEWAIFLTLDDTLIALLTMKCVYEVEKMMALAFP